MTKLKRIIAGASLVASIAITNVGASENAVSQEERTRIDREADSLLKELENDLQKLKTAQKPNKSSTVSNEDKLVKDALRELELETQFKNSPYLYQKYNGYVDRYIKDAKRLKPEEAKQAARVIAELDKKYFNQLCEDSYGPAHKSEFVFDTEIENGERRLVYNKDSYILCGPENSDFVEIFRLKREHCESNDECDAHQFGQDTICSCKSDNEDDDIFGAPLNEEPAASMNKANDKKVAMVQSMLHVQGR